MIIIMTSVNLYLSRPRRDLYTSFAIRMTKRIFGWNCNQRLFTAHACTFANVRSQIACARRFPKADERILANLRPGRRFRAADDLASVARASSIVVEGGKKRRKPRSRRRSQLARDQRARNGK